MPLPPPPPTRDQPRVASKSAGQFRSVEHSASRSLGIRPPVIGTVSDDDEDDSTFTSGTYRRRKRSSASESSSKRSRVSFAAFPALPAMRPPSQRQVRAPPPPKAPPPPRRPPPINALLPQRNDGTLIENERAEERMRSGDVARCSICWEQQEHDDSLASTNDAASEATDASRRSALVDSTRRFRSIIFAFERRLRGRAHDDVIFEGMLVLRRAFVERVLREHNERYRVWTIDMLRRHYAPVGGHTFDPIRTLVYELAELGHVQQMVMKHALFVVPPESDDPAATSLGGSREPLFNVRAVDTRMRLAKQRAELTKQLNIELARTDDVESRIIMQSVTELSRLLGGSAPPSHDDASLVDDIESRYDVGGWNGNGDDLS